ncbi:hypothetical protein RR46_08635 [Papilio xuthus]|uniref:Uncharacterized protein n=1 Tax=Papilio xuthus TaxID=66420 RepID=A0A194Q7V1_PAPXU|nr:hypothetical protein RR46_08635 [Papilio xuthus]
MSLYAGGTKLGSRSLPKARPKSKSNNKPNMLNYNLTYRISIPKAHQKHVVTLASIARLNTMLKVGLMEYQAQ